MEKTYTCNCVCGLALIDRNTASTQSVIATVFGLAKQATEIKKPAPVAEPDKPGAAKTSLDPAAIEIWDRAAADGDRENEFIHLPTDHHQLRAQHSNLFLHMPLFDEIFYEGYLEGKVREYKAVREDQPCRILP